MWHPYFLQNLYFESVFSAIIVILSSMIYLRTRELYELTKHAGIKYFRQAFLFFGLTFFTLLIMPLFKQPGPMRLAPEMILLGTLIIFFETVAILSLLYSVIWKRINLKNVSAPIFVIAAVLALLGPLRISQAQDYIHPILFLLALLLSIYNYFFNKEKKHFSIHLMYVLLFLSLLVHNIGKSLIPSSTWVAAVFYLISVGLFSLIFYKVWKSTKNEEKR